MEQFLLSAAFNYTCHTLSRKLHGTSIRTQIFARPRLA
jgi:hypothetical protein